MFLWLAWQWFTVRTQRVIHGVRKYEIYFECWPGHMFSSIHDIVVLIYYIIHYSYCSKNRTVNSNAFHNNRHMLYYEQSHMWARLLILLVVETSIQLNTLFYIINNVAWPPPRKWNWWIKMKNNITFPFLVPTKDLQDPQNQNCNFQELL